MRKEEFIMNNFIKKVLLKYGHVIASFALFIMTIGVNVTCCAEIYQPKLPESAKKLRKF